VHCIPADSAAGRDIVVRRWHLQHAVLGWSDDNDLSVELPPLVIQPEWHGRGRRDVSRIRDPDSSLRITGDAARRVVTRSMLDYNRAGGTRGDVDAALDAISAAGGAADFIRTTAGSGASIVRQRRYGGAQGATYSLRQIAGTFRGEILPVVKYRNPFFDELRPALAKPDALALEMALQEEAERAALEGELTALEAAWREAEEIARIADALPDDAGD
jgi:hypothetical protein